MDPSRSDEPGRRDAPIAAKEKGHVAGSPSVGQSGDMPRETPPLQPFALQIGWADRAEAVLGAFGRIAEGATAARDRAGEWRHR